MVGVSIDTVLAAAFAALTVALGTISLALFVEWLQERQRQRRIVFQLRTFDQTAPAAAPAGIFRGSARRSQIFQAVAARMPGLANLELALRQSGAAVSVEAIVLLSAGLAIACGLGAAILTRLWPIAVVAAIGGGLAPSAWASVQRRRRLTAFEAKLPEAIDLLARAIRAGHPLSAGFKMVADETQEPIAGEFRRTFEEQRFGLPFDDAVVAMADRVALIDVRILVTAILIQREVGGNLAEVLDNLSSVIRARFTIRRQLRTYTAQGRISGYVLAILPIAVGLALHLLNPGYLQLLFSVPVGRLMLGTALAMQLIGYLWIRRIVAVEI